jgi:hypothetical protein
MEVVFKIIKQLPGLSMQVFKEWCSDEKNLLIIPGYCVAGTLGNKLLGGIKKIFLDGKTYDIKMKIRNMSFSAHADAKGILSLIKHTEPRNVVFVHGEKKKMDVLKEVIVETFKLPCWDPANFKTVKIEIPNAYLPLFISPSIIKEFNALEEDYLMFSSRQKKHFKGCAITVDNTDIVKVMDSNETINELNTLLKMLKQDDIDRIGPHRLEEGECIKLRTEYVKVMKGIARNNPEKYNQIILNDLKLKISDKLKR